MISQPLHWSIQAEGELVTLAIGNCAWSMEFVDALRVSLEMKDSAKIAKRAAGDEGRVMNVAGILEDLEKKAAVMPRWGASLPDRVTQIHAKPVGLCVRLQIGRTYADVDHRAAFAIAKWLRMRGKQARNHARERAHWLDLATDRDSRIEVLQ